MVLYLVPDDVSLSSPVGLQFLAALRGRLSPHEVDWNSGDGLAAADVRWVVEAAIALFENEADVSHRFLARQALLHAGGPAWIPETARAYLEAMQGLRALPDRGGEELVARVVTAMLALPAEEGVVRGAARALLALAQAHGSRPRVDRVTNEAVLTLAAAAGADLDREVIGRVRLEFGQELALIELDAIARLPFAARSRLMAFGLYRDPALGERRSAAAATLARDPVYAQAARAMLEALAERLGDIHGGRIPYVSDRAAGKHEVVPATRAFEVASAEDAPWFGEQVGRLLPWIVVAPGTAKTLPSQSLAVALSHATAARPTPESVAALAEAARVVRHAGIKKKLERDLRAARKALSASARLIPRSRQAEPGRAARSARSKELTAFRSAMEASFDREPRAVDPWLRDLLADPVLGTAAAEAIWTIDGPRTGRVSCLSCEGELRALDGSPVKASGEDTVRPWHPVTATPEERARWCELLARQRRRQPFRQAFREWYVPPREDLDATSTSMFAGIVASAKPLIGLARREGWRLTFDGLRREVGGWAIELLTEPGDLYPGLMGPVAVGSVQMERQMDGRWHHARLREVPPVTLSEALRAVDLLTSVAGFGVEAGEAAKWSETLHRLDRLPLRGQALARRRALESVLRTHPEAHRLRFGDRYLEVAGSAGEHRLHYATGFSVSPDGEVNASRSIAPAAAHAVPWLPYDEALLELLVREALTLLERPGSGRP